MPQPAAHAKPQDIPESQGSAPKRQVLVLGMPWFRSGAGTVVRSQIAYFNHIGWRTIYVCVPRFALDFSPPSKLLTHYRHAGELGADEVHFADYWPLEFRQKANLRQRLRDRLSDSREDALQTTMRAAGQSGLPPDLKATLSEESIDLILVNHVYAMPFGLKIVDFLRYGGKKAPIILATHDIQTLILIDNNLIPGRSKDTSFEEFAEFRTELHYMNRCDALIHVSVTDTAFFTQILPRIPQSTVYPYVTPPRQGLNDDARGRDKEFLFVGVEHIANVKALEWFFRNVWPEFSARPLKLTIVGSVCEAFSRLCPDIHKLYHSHFLGHVDDLAPHYTAATAVLAPMMSGRGISVKTIEAAAAGKPIIGMPHAFRGIPPDLIDECGIEVPETAAGFAQQMNRALTDPEPMRIASRKLHERLFRFEAFTSSMDHALESVGIRP